MTSWVDLPWLTADASALVEAARASDPGKDKDLHLLLEETRVSVAADGSSETRRRLVYLVRTREGADAWGMLADSWSPWREDKPQIAARVITPDGVAHTLDPSSISESVERSADPLILSDVHSVHAPLPLLGPGCIVEETVIDHARAPLVPQGGVLWLPLARNGGVDRTIIHVEVADGPAFAWKVESSDVKPVEKHVKGVHTLDVDLGARAFTAAWESNVPPDVRPPVLYVSTAKGWSELATAYSAVVDEQLAGAALEDRARAVVGTLTDPHQRIRALVDDARKLRYTGVEFGRAAIVPGKPGDVLARGYGDCKDKATLLVGMLRAVGIPAEVALLSPGFGADIAPLPGLDDFTHAIVHIDGAGADEWVDPTDDWTPVGALPYLDQGRLALVASPTTRAPIRTPVAAAAQNVIHIEREVELAPAGPAHVVERVTRTGWPAAELRPDFASATPEQVHDWFVSQANDVYLSPTIDPPTHSDPRDLDSPLRTELVVPASDYGTTYNDGALVRFARKQAFDWLPTWLIQAPDAVEDPRKQALLVPPHRVEIDQRIHGPVPYVPDSPPEAVHDQVGPFSWSIEYEKVADDTLVAHMRFDTGEGRLAAGDVATLRTHLSDLLATDVPLVRFDHAGSRLLEDGHVSDALAVYHHAVEAAPKDAMALDRWALTLLRLGYGESARRAVKDAWALAPDNAEIAADVGYVLLHDPDGSYLGNGWDRAGAAAVVQAAIARGQRTKRLYSILDTTATYGDDGVLWGPGSSVPDAVAALRESRKLTKDGSADADLCTALTMAGDLAGLEALLAELPAGGTRDTFTVVAAQLRSGKGVEVAQHLAGGSESRHAALEQAASQMMQLRRYADAGAMIEAAAATSDNPAANRSRAEFVKAVRPYETVRPAAGDPEGLLARLLSEGHAAHPDSHAILAKDLIQGSDDVDFAGLFLEAMRGAARKAGLPEATLLDVTVGAFTTTVEGDAKSGWRVRYRSRDSKMSVFFYAVLEGGVVKLRANPGQYGELGEQALSVLDHGDLDGARRWLDWAAEETGKPAAGDPYDNLVFAHLWHAGGDATLARTAAATLAVLDPTRAATAMPLVETARAATTDPELLLAYDRSLVTGASVLEHDAEVLTLAERMAAARPTDAQPLRIALTAALKLKRPDAPARLEALRKVDPDSVVTARYALSVALQGPDAAARWAACQALANHPKAAANDLNNAAWHCQDHPAEALGWAQRANSMSGYADSAALQTLAVLFDTNGRPDEAMEVILQADKARGADDDAHDGAWAYARGRVAESWHLPELARAEYTVAAAAKVEAEADAETPDDVVADAKTRLAALGGPLPAEAPAKAAPGSPTGKPAKAAKPAKAR